MQKVFFFLVHTIRRLFYYTPLPKWRLTNFIYQWLFRQLTRGKQYLDLSYFDLTFRVPSRDVILAPGIMGGHYEEVEISIFKSLAPKAVVVDIGANIGLYTCVAARSGASRVISFEPVADNFQLLNHNVKINQLQNVSLVEAALGNRSGYLTLYMSADSTATHSAVKNGHQADQTKVKLIKLDEYCRRYRTKPSLIKCDVEGYDGHVLKGALATIRQYPLTLFIEYNPATLRSSGFGVPAFINFLTSEFKVLYGVHETKHYIYKINDLRAIRTRTQLNLIASNHTQHIRRLNKYVAGLV